jgi:hypothetical protein
VIGEKDKKWFSVCKNISFMTLDHFLRVYRKKIIKSILILDHISYLHPDSFNIFKKLKPNIYTGADIKGDDELYISQVMGLIPDILFSEWHDNYIDKNNLSFSDLPDDLLEVYISRYKKHNHEFNFNQYRTLKYKSVVYTKNDIFKYIKTNKIYTVKDLLINLNVKKYIKSGCWYTNDENKNIIERLYK